MPLSATALSAENEGVEVAEARKIIAAFERPENASRGRDPARGADGGAVARDCDCGRIAAMGQPYNSREWTIRASGSGYS